MTDDFLRSVAVSGSSVPVSRSIIIVIVRVIVNDDLFTSGLLKFTSQLLLSGATLFCFVFFSRFAVFHSVPSTPFTWSQNV